MGLQQLRRGSRCGLEQWDRSREQWDRSLDHLRQAPHKVRNRMAIPVALRSLLGKGETEV